MRFTILRITTLTFTHNLRQYVAGPGYDLATGIGYYQANNLYSVWSPIKMSSIFFTRRVPARSKEIRGRKTGSSQTNLPRFQIRPAWPAGHENNPNCSSAAGGWALWLRELNSRRMPCFLRNPAIKSESRLLYALLTKARSA